jgi:hypothetical protein
MAKFTVTDPHSGQKVTLTSEDNTPPTERELEEVFSSMSIDGNGSSPFSADEIDPELEQSQQTESHGVGGLAGAGIEVARGLGHGTGQMIADAGFIANAGGLAKNPVGTGIQNAGLSLMAGAEALPETDMPGIVKGGLNLVGEAAPMLATFGAGEAVGLARLGEGAVKTMAVASRSPIAAHYLKGLVRPMGQATLFGTVNAIDTAATLPETMEFKERVQAISDSGRNGFIAGAVLTPIMDKGIEVIRKFGKNAGKVYYTNILGSKEAAEQAMNLSRTQGSYPSLIIDPHSPDKIKFVEQEVRKLSREEMVIQHDNIIRDQELAIRGVRDTHEELSRKLQDTINDANFMFDETKRKVLGELDNSLNIKKANGEYDINTNLGRIAQGGEQALSKMKLANSQNLTQTAQAFEANVESTAKLLGENSASIYETVAKHEPTGGFDVRGVISKIQESMKRYHKVDIRKDIALPQGLDPAKLSPEARKQFMAAGKPVWKASTNSVTGEIPIEAKKVVDYLTNEQGLLVKLEELAKSNEGKISLDMLRNEMSVVDGLAYRSGPIKDKGFADLYGAIRPNRLVGDLNSMADKGFYRGSDNALKELKMAGSLDSAYSTIMKDMKEVRSMYLDGLESKAKSFEKNQSALGKLRQFEDSIGLPRDSKLRMTNAMNNYARTSSEIASRTEKLADAISQATRNQKARLNSIIESTRKSESERLVGEKFAQREEILAKKRKALDDKKNELRQADDLLYRIREGIRQETMSRKLAEHEMSMLSKGDSFGGRLQRGSLMASGMGMMTGSPHTPITTAVTFALSPRVAVSAGRLGKKLASNPTLRKAGQIIERAGKSSVAQKLLIGELLRISDSSRRQK